jgi:hypothetical protein
MDKNLFDFEWKDVWAGESDERSATWALLKIQFEDQIISHHEVVDAKLTAEELCLPLYNIAEWIVLNWWHLFYENNDEETHFDQRHNLKYAGNGYALPDLMLIPEGGSFYLKWKSYTHHFSGINFISNGQGRTNLGSLKSQLSEFVGYVILRLEHKGIKQAILQQEWSAIISADNETESFCRAAAAIGKDPYNLSEKEENDILEVGNLLDAALHNDFFGAIGPALDFSVAKKISDSLESLKNEKINWSGLSEIKSELYTGKLGHGLPWDQGYMIARKLRQILQLNEKEVFDKESLAKIFDAPESIYNNDLSLNGASERFDALVASNLVGSPSMAFSRPDKETAVKFAFCRCLFEYLVSKDGHPRLLTQSTTVDQKRNRAFAAEFLAPSNSIRSIIARRVSIHDSEIENIASQLQVSYQVVRWQIINHDLAKVRD